MQDIFFAQKGVEEKTDASFIREVRYADVVTAEYVADIAVNLGDGDRFLLLYKDPLTGALLALDPEQLDSEETFVYSPYTQGMKLVIPPVEFSVGYPVNGEPSELKDSYDRAILDSVLGTTEF